MDNITGYSIPFLITGKNRRKTSNRIFDVVKWMLIRKSLLLTVNSNLKCYRKQMKTNMPMTNTNCNTDMFTLRHLTIVNILYNSNIVSIHFFSILIFFPRKLMDIYLSIFMKCIDDI